MTWEEDIANFRLPLHLHPEGYLWVQALIMEGRAGGQQAGGEGCGDVLGTSYCRRLGDWLLCSTLTVPCLLLLHPTSPSHSGVWPAHSLIIVSFTYLATWRSQFQQARSSIFFVSSLVAVYGIQFPDQGRNPGPLHLEHKLLATGPPGLSQMVSINSSQPPLFEHAFCFA